ncbi:hypothetical protein L873DRAFT_1848805 [Choiromyces venosus 120613-1]|uniref:Uncharacterized protein n=1 Tax=Choiromyces venosus 120613-1 TaxID=1336337 RepID=A0A3N4IWX0_9PEZI|nr:hypothetical protein L873DRAFT_1848805 [Choiromyces venosus 120613-1]
MDVLMWISYSEDPFELEELCEALGVELGTSKLDRDNLPSIRIVMGCSLGFITVDSSSSKPHLMIAETRPLDEEGSPKGFAGLHGVSYFGVEEILVALLQIKEWDINATDQGGNTVLGWAMRQWNEGVAIMLLNRSDINPDMADNSGRTPLRGKLIMGSVPNRPGRLLGPGGL